jgi:hypothetical protein
MSYLEWDQLESQQRAQVISKIDGRGFILRIQKCRNYQNTRNHNTSAEINTHCWIESN